jgi:hypothetical protein
MQQGRVVMDADVNDAARIQEHEHSRAHHDLIGAHGTPDERGFRIENPRVDGNRRMEFDIHAGSYYVAGLHLEMEAPGDTYRTQKDWLHAPDIPVRLGGAPRYDLVYLEVWQQDVTPVEDGELKEKALGGPDTAGRVRTMRRVHVHPGVGEPHCDKAWPLVKAELGLETADTEAVELEATERLTVTFNQSAPDEDLCSPTVEAGYLGAENQAIRVQITRVANNRSWFTWGFDNASLLFAAELVDGATEFKLKDKPRDFFQRPVAGQVVEIIPYGAELANGERIGDLVGHMSKITDSYDEESGSITIADAWTPPDGETECLVRIWARGTDSGSAAELAVSPGTSTALGNTGIDVTFAGGTHRPGDYWVVAARPDDPSVVLPWKLLDGPDHPHQVPGSCEPHGYRRYYAPLAVIRWGTTNQQTVTGSITDDCRRVFLPLGKLEQPCCVHVKAGDNVHRALRRVVKAGGGCICLGRGMHRLTEPIDLSGTNDITIRGSGDATLVDVSGVGYDAANAATTTPFILRDCHNAHFESFTVLNPRAGTVWYTDACVGLALRGVRVVSVIPGVRAPIASATTTINAAGSLVNLPIISAQGSRSRGWRIDNCFMNGYTGLVGSGGVYDLRIADSTWLTWSSAVSMRTLYRCRFERNLFAGMGSEFAEYIRRLDTSNLSEKTSLEDVLRQFVDAVEMYANEVNKRPNHEGYTGIATRALIESRITYNQFVATNGILGEAVDDCTIRFNEWITDVYAVSCGPARHLTFEYNRVGARPSIRGTDQEDACDIGLRVQGEATACRVSNNEFRNVGEAVAFEGFEGGRDVIRVAASGIKRFARTDTASRKAVALRALEAVRVNERSRMIASSSFYRVGRGERILIADNEIHASKAAVRWSDTWDVVDFRISGNVITGCEEIAIMLELESVSSALRSRVDTRMRIVAKNRFEVSAPAIVSNLDGMRIEKNDIRIKGVENTRVFPWGFIKTFNDDMFKNPVLKTAVESRDIGLTKMAVTKGLADVRANPSTVNTRLLSANLASLSTPSEGATSGVSLGKDALLLAEMMPLIDLNAVLPSLSDFLDRVTFVADAYAVNLSGLQNHVVHNRIHSDNDDVQGGVKFLYQAGEIRDNEIEVSKYAVYVAGTASPLRDASNDIEISGNTLRAVGAAARNVSVQALYVPTIQPGNMLIADNRLEGRVSIGGDPVRASRRTVTTKPDLTGGLALNHGFMLTSATFARHAKNFSVFGPACINDDVVAIPGLIPLPGTTKERATIQFANNRVVGDSFGIMESFASGNWSKATLAKRGDSANVINVVNNVVDRSGVVIGRDVILLGNNSQTAIEYHAFGQKRIMANIPNAEAYPETSGRVSVLPGIRVFRPSIDLEASPLTHFTNIFPFLNQ